MVDREARDKMAVMLRHLASGQVSCEEFDRAVSGRSRDEGIGAALSLRDRLAAARADGIWDSEIGKWAETGEEPQEQRFTGDSALRPEERRDLARTVLFLQSDLEYRWGSVRLSWWQALLLAPVLMAGLVIAAAVFCAAVAGGAAGISVFFACAFVIYRASNWVGTRITGRDMRCWPFYLATEYEEALKRPRLLSGRGV